VKQDKVREGLGHRVQAKSPKWAFVPIFPPSVPFKCSHVQNYIFHLYNTYGVQCIEIQQFGAYFVGKKRQNSNKIYIHTFRIKRQPHKWIECYNPLAHISVIFGAEGFWSICGQSSLFLLSGSFRCATGRNFRKRLEWADSWNNYDYDIFIILLVWCLSCVGMAQCLSLEAHIDMDKHSRGSNHRSSNWRTTTPFNTEPQSPVCISNASGVSRPWDQAKLTRWWMLPRVLWRYEVFEEGFLLCIV